jgi:hypothetical protein
MTPGAATAGYRGSAALVSGQTYSYAIKDGNNYEDGQTVWNGTTLTRVVNISSNSNTAISLSGAATVVITELSADFPDMGRLFKAGQLLSANFNSTADQAITLNAPVNAAGTSIWALYLFLISNPSTSLTTAKGAFYAAASKTSPLLSGLATTTFVALKSATDAAMFGAFPSTALSTSGAADNLYFTSSSTTVYLSLTTAQGAAATADIRVFGLSLN